MKKMKSKVMIALVLGMMLLCVACGDNPNKEDSDAGAATSGVKVPATEITTPTATPTATPVPLREVVLGTEFVIEENERVAVGSDGVELSLSYIRKYEEYGSVSIGCRLVVDGEESYCSATWTGSATVLGQDPETAYDIHMTNVAEDKITLKVVEKPKPQEPLDLSDWTEEYYTTEKLEYMEGDFFVVYLDKDVTIPKDIVERLNQVVAWTEEAMGLKLNNDSMYSEYRDVRMLEYAFGYGAFPGMPQDPGREKIQIFVTDYGKTRAGFRTIYINPFEMEMANGQSKGIFAAMVSVITHTNGVGPGQGLEKGYCRYIAEEIMKKHEIEEKFGSQVVYENLCSMTAEEAETKFDTICETISDPDGYGECFVTYLYETYGADTFTNIVAAAQDTVIMEYDPYPNPAAIKDIVVQNTDANVFAGFVQWLAENADRF